MTTQPTPNPAAHEAEAAVNSRFFWVGMITTLILMVVVLLVFKPVKALPSAAEIGLRLGGA